jgi:hypothetical protein
MDLAFVIAIAHTFSRAAIDQIILNLDAGSISLERYALDRSGNSPLEAELSTSTPLRLSRQLPPFPDAI